MKTVALGYSVGKRMAGRICAADEAFHRLEWEVARLDNRGTWTWFADRFCALEAALADAGGFNERLADLIEDPNGFIGSKEAVDRHFETEDICAELEELAAAFFVSLQPRLNAVKIAAKRVYAVAVQVDGLEITRTSGPTLPGDAEVIWQVANYVKHSDEWKDPLDSRQQTCFGALLQLGVASFADGRRELTRWVLIAAACAISHETTMARAVEVIVRKCKTSAHEIEEAVQRDFADIVDALEALRERNATRLRLRPGENA